jgi:hypothetical protein
MTALFGHANSVSTIKRIRFAKRNLETIIIKILNKKIKKKNSFLWRLSHNTLALRKVLQRWSLQLDPICCMCGRLDEDGGHLLLFKCKEDRKVWMELSLEEVLANAGTAKESRR